MKRGLAVVVAVAACSKTGEPAPAKGPASQKASAATGGACADAGACDKGCASGRLEDCHELAWRKIGARGVAIDVAGAEKLLARACAGKLARSCGMAAWIEAGDGRELAAARRAELDKSCRAGDGWSCAALANWALRPSSPGRSGVRDTAGGATWAELGCAAGHVWSCATLEQMLAQVAPGPDWTQEMRERVSKARAMIEEKRSAACGAGKREGCREGSPDFMALVRRDCAAGDHGACSELASYSEDGAEGMRAAQDACERGRLSSVCGMVCNGLRDGFAGEPDLAAARACYERACAGGDAVACRKRDAGPLLGGGCAGIDMEREPHLGVRRLPRLRAPRKGGGSFDSERAARRGRLYVFTASWNTYGRIADLEPLAIELRPLEIEVVAVLSDPGWERLPDVGDAPSFTAILDPPRADATTGAYTSRLGITKVPEAMLVDASGAVRRHLVGPGVLTSRINARRCAADVLGAPRDRK